MREIIHVQEGQWGNQIVGKLKEDSWSKHETWNMKPECIDGQNKSEPTLAIKRSSSPL